MRNGKSKRPHGDKVEPAASIIVKFGGVRALARLLKLDPSTITKWQTASLRRDRVSSGSDGLIPARYHWSLLKLAGSMGVKLTAEELIRHE
jgi:hypothetical protein